jgi:hypothetical protein
MKNLMIGFVCILLAVQVAWANNTAAAITVTPTLGMDFFASKRDLNTASVLPAMALTYNVDDTWAIEGFYGALNTSYHSDSHTGSVNGHLYLVDGLYRFQAKGRCQPYLTGGLGVLYLNPNGTDAANQGNINIGAGTQLFFAENIALRGDIKDLYTMSGGKNDVLVSLGVSFLFQ